MEKRGQELSIGTLILIVLGVIVLVLLVLGFSMGWSNLFAKLNIFTASDLSTMATKCELAVNSDSKADFCEEETVKGQTGKVTCVSDPVKPLLSQAVTTKINEKGWTRCP